MSHRIAVSAAALTFAASVANAGGTDVQAAASGRPPLPVEPSFLLAQAASGGKTASPAAPANQQRSSKSAEASGPVAQGKRLVDTHDCHACHTPMKMGPNGPEPDMSLALSGHPQTLVMPPPPKLEGPWGWVAASTNTAFAGPWGTSYAINLTPDPETGLGKWQESEFVQAIKTGKHLGVGRPIMPPMPWPAYRNLTDSQLRAIYAYLRSIPPIKNKAPDYVAQSK
jgi:mono/diheme cytochrome c family protein